MSEEITKQETDVAPHVDREELMDFEAYLRTLPGAVIGDNIYCPLKHSFGEGIYMREIFIPAGMVLTGKIHKYDHPYVILEGELIVATEDGVVHIEAPYSGISPAGVKRAAHVIQDTRWITFHKNESNTQDLDELEKAIIASSYEAYEEFRKGIEESKKQITNNQEVI